MYRKYKSLIQSRQSSAKCVADHDKHLEQNCFRNIGSSRGFVNSQDLNAKALVAQCWKLVEKQCINHIDNVEKTQKQTVSVPRGTWRTVRVFVSSTFADCHSEREVLVKQVFPALREWCEARYLHLVECDLRWGVPRETDTHDTISICMGELDRCHEETNRQPFFLNITGHRYGWIPSEQDISDDIRKKYEWVPKMSITAMEVLHGAYRAKNPNAAFFLRDGEFMEDLPEKHRKRFEEDSNIAVEQLMVLREKLELRFPDQVFRYTCKYDGVDDSTGREKVKLSGLDTFGEQVLGFFKAAIEKMYPDQQDFSQLQEEQQETETHRTFLEHKSEFVIGRDEDLQMLLDFANGKTNPSFQRMDNFQDDEYSKWKEFFGSEDEDVPILCVSAPPGLGKSALVAKVARMAQEEGINVLYHSVQCSPVGGRPERILGRILNVLTDNLFDEEMKKAEGVSYSKIIEKFQEVLKEKQGCERKFLIVLDGLNEMNTHEARHHLAWLPPSFPGSVRCIVSANDEHKFTMERIAQRCPYHVQLSTVGLKERQAIVQMYLGKFNKTLDHNQLLKLTSHEGAAVPLWLSLACEELRVFGDFSTLTNKICSLPESLKGLLALILDRLLKEDDTQCLEKLLCLMEMSPGGVPEKLILPLLGDFEQKQPAAMMTWATLRRHLKAFVRTEAAWSLDTSRVRFFHQSVSEVVRQRFLAEDQMIQHWHKVLADFYQYHCQDGRFLVDELPHHLVQAGLNNRLVDFYRKDPKSVSINLYIRREHMQDLRCRSVVHKNQPTAIAAMLCQTCSYQHGVFHPHKPGDRCCMICGDHVWAHNKGNAMICPFHSPHPRKSCINCGSMIVSTAAQLCTFCSFGHDRCVHLG